jgi:hypothetical protein
MSPGSRVAAGLKPNLLNTLRIAAFSGMTSAINSLSPASRAIAARWRISSVPDALALVRVDDHKGDLGPAGFDDNVASAADNDRPAVLIDQRNQCDMVVEVDIHEESDLLRGEATLHGEETSLQRLHSGAADRGEHVVLVIGSKRADFDLASVAEMFDCVAFTGYRHAPPNFDIRM